MSDEIRPAASLILMRDRLAGPPEVLIVQRGPALAFAAGAYVFPGGRVDPEDGAIAARLCPDLAPDEGAARIAAVRETWEEAAVVVALRPAPTPEAAPFVDPLADFDAGALIPFARWLPKGEATPRRFDTRFYLARGESGDAPIADGVESVQAFWATAEQVLERCRAGQGRAIFPTRRLLERLARFADFDEAREEAERLPPRIITPWVEERDGSRWLCIPGDAGYPVVEERIETAARY
jgi:8-oxo-dGTP pyrophosphatase MutT (NUDIX family)